MGEQYSILERAKEGDNEAISELYSQNYYAVLGAIRSLVSDQDESMDLLQDAFLKAFANLDQLRGDFTPWAKRIAVNTAKDYLRKKKPILFTQMEGDDTDTGTPIEESFGQESAEGRPETILDSQETERLLGEILGSLPEEQRIVINLCYYQEMSYKEISETLGIPENLVRSRLNLGREKVKKQVLALEKKGTKLYGLAPLPFLMFLYRSIEADAAGARPDASSIQEFLGALEGAGNTAPIAGAASPDPGTSIGSMAAKASVPAGVKASIAACTLAAVVGGSVFLAGMIPQKQEQALTPERIEYYSSEGELVQVMEYDPDTPFQTNQHALKTGIPSPLPHRVYEYTEDGMEETLCMSYVYEYDSEGRVIGRFAYDGSSNQEGDRPRSSTEWEFDEEGRLSRETSYGYTDNADDDEPSPVTVTEWIYDEDALICRINNYDIIDGEPVLIERGELLCDSDWKPQEAHYEPLIKGLIEQHFTYQYDSSGRLQYYTQCADASFERKREAVEYRYDSKGNLREITVESYSNDENGNRQARIHLLRYVYPDTLMDELGDYEWFVWGSG